MDGACYGTYILVVTNEKDCFVEYSIDLVLYLSTTAIENIPALFTLTAVPSGQTLVQNNTPEHATLNCYDLAGNLILATVLNPGLNHVNVPSATPVFLYQINQGGQLLDAGKMNHYLG